MNWKIRYRYHKLAYKILYKIESKVRILKLYKFFSKRCGHHQAEIYKILDEHYLECP